MKIKVSTKAKMFSYHNDDPFAYSRLQNRNYIKSLDLMDWNYVYRVKNVNDVKKYSKYCEVLLPYPNTDCIFPIKDIEKKYDVVFIGHYEDDGRDRVICELIKDDSINFMLFGTNWDKSKSYAFIQENLGEILPVYLNDYNRVLNESKIALCFFSSLNNDEYTRRTFEIPASGTILLSQYSKESTMILKPNIEAVYFTSTLNLITQLKQYLSNESLRAEIAINGFNKVINGGHTYLDRVKQIIHRFNSIVDDSNNIS